MKRGSKVNLKLVFSPLNLTDVSYGRTTSLTTDDDIPLRPPVATVVEEEYVPASEWHTRSSAA